MTIQEINKNLILNNKIKKTKNINIKKKLRYKAGHKRCN